MLTPVTLRVIANAGFFVLLSSFFPQQKSHLWFSLIHLIFVQISHLILSTHALQWRTHTHTHMRKERFCCSWLPIEKNSIITQGTWLDTLMFILTINQPANKKSDTARRGGLKISCLVSKYPQLCVFFVLYDSRQQLCFTLLHAGFWPDLMYFHCSTHLWFFFLIQFQSSLCQDKKAAMWFSLPFTLLLAYTPPQDVKYLTAASHNYTGSDVKIAICLAVCHFWPSGNLWFPRSSPGSYVKQRGSNFSRMTGRTGRWKDVRKMSDAHISIRPDRCTFPSFRYVFRGLGAHSSHPMRYLIKWGAFFFNKKLHLALGLITISAPVLLMHLHFLKVVQEP